MSSYLSVISAVIRPEIKEKISIGLLLIGGGNFFLEFSRNKIEVLGQLLSDDSFRAVKLNVKSFEKMASSNEGRFNLFAGNLTATEKIKNTVFGESYLTYLSKYKNNLITFSEPNPITLNATTEVFNKLFNNLVDERGVDTAHKIERGHFHKFRESSILRDRFNYNYEVNQDVFPDLIIPIKIDFVGRNERPTFVKLMDLERRKDFITNDVSKFNFIKDSIQDSQRFIVSREPDKNRYRTQHQIWQNLRNTRLFDYIDESEIERLETYAVGHDVQKIDTEQQNG